MDAKMLNEVRLMLVLDHIDELAEEDHAVPQLAKTTYQRTLASLREWGKQTHSFAALIEHLERARHMTLSTVPARMGEAAAYRALHGFCLGLLRANAVIRME